MINISLTIEDDYEIDQFSFTTLWSSVIQLLDANHKIVAVAVVVQTPKN